MTTYVCPNGHEFPPQSVLPCPECGAGVAHVPAAVLFREVEHADLERDALFRCVELTGEDTSGGIPTSPTLPQWAIENVARLREEADAADEQLSKLWVCEWGHVSNVARFPNAEGVRRCFFCSHVVRPGA